MTFLPISLDNKDMLNELSSLATEIVREHYDPILGPKQNDYMLDKFQSVSAMQSQLESGYRYYLVEDNEKKIGFIGFYPRNGKLYLSKFYIHKESRKKGYATKMLHFIIYTAKSENLNAVFLNVNKYNDDSIAVYQHLGFKMVGDEKNDIGNGYYMDDYVMELTW